MRSPDPEITQNHPLFGAAAKIGRAKKLLQDVRQVSDQFKQDVAASQFGSLDPDHLNYRVFASASEASAPLVAPLLTGEILYQLRSSLDHLITGLAIANGGQATTNHQFPVCYKEAAFRSAVKGKRLEGLSELAKAWVEKAQPFKLADPSQSTLGWLSSLNNRDKHRLLTIVLHGARIGDTLEVGSDIDNGPPIEVQQISPPNPVPLTAEPTEIFRVGLSSPTEGFFAKSELRIDLYIQVEETGDLKPLIETLEHIMRYAEKMYREAKSLLGG